MKCPAATLAPDSHAEALPASFRDPSGFVYRGPRGQLLRQVNRCYERDYLQLMDSGLYADLTADGLLIEHAEVDRDLAASEDARWVIQPRELPFISYPYEWSFSALRDAALLTLKIQRRALQAGMSLKDASAFNVQFEGSHPVLIDSLSFETHQPGQPWQAYGQFCRHFLAPLALMARRDIRLGQLTRLHLDGVPLDLASKMLPWRTRVNLGLAVHLHLHARLVRRCGDTSQPSAQKARGKQLSQQGLEALLDNLARTVEKLAWQPRGTQWADYYENNSYSEAGFEQKKASVREFLQRTSPSTVWDLGANRGVFSRLATELGAHTCAFDIDPACVEQNYRQARAAGARQLLPLQLDLTNPTPAIGWNLDERDSLLDRGPCDTILALALVHHLALSHNLPLPRIARFLHRLGRRLIVEFVPKQDPQAQRLLMSREDIFPDYCQAGFESAFCQWFTTQEAREIGDDGRVLYLMQARNAGG